MSSLIHRLPRRRSLSAVQLVYAPHPQWPLPPSDPLRPPPSRPLAISVLDSSFNPPTLAHLALANSPRPGHADYDARLLLLSVRNVDKTLKPGDASHAQRVDMMRLLSQHITNTADNIAIALIDEPTFVGKSKRLLSFLKQRFDAMVDTDNTMPPPVQLTFILGLDTLERLFAQRYYGSEQQMLLALRRFFSPAPEGDDSFVVCARRISDNSKVVTEQNAPSLKHADEYLASGRIVMVDIGTNESSLGSTIVRDAVKQHGLDDPSWKSCVTASIAEYITRERLYIAA
ncbi:hypothetical protein AX17_002329 [Amanita inopinata Kibby_2008]|nr:hypothetical protein AX17_002329 [Amanita inopinata Kibby_2008]